MDKHSHSISGETTINDGHIHNYGEVTSIEPSGVPHIHYIKGITTYHEDHAHEYETRTGPSITMPNGLHYHYYEAQVKFADGHHHFIRGYTSAE
ncbi:YmaF family protein [Clostridium sp. 'White wine YQ']|uniref:YmaF family protein n=1 Tax=Clostridium sp. 'White wine YQ' TaxID=3027474 RepID=UPI0023661B11|nr:YmaF family protein [Clostridium sp. 'White wine YQ']MDD7793522.1 YmaF family protein [Clostridium sp. 'White wine YQ']